MIDGPGSLIGQSASPIRVEVHKGRAVSVSGRGREAAQLRSIKETVANADNIAEFGIGLNGACRQNGRFEEEKKGRGNVHIALGDNTFYGGSVQSPVHLDLVIYRPTVHLDDRVLVEDGTVRLS
ncbi:MAG: hypothetical protein OXG37_01570 [Actinomycetia bacterium]|nr:hypothetical protein [Actinomycetes bacterium]